MKYRIKDKDIDCEHYKSKNKEGIIPVCSCKMGRRGDLKNLRMFSSILHERLKNEVHKTRK